MAGAWERTIGWGACAGAVLLLIVALIGVRVEAAAGTRVGDAVVQLAAVAGRPGAGYFTVRGGPATLESVSSPLASRIELHSSSMAGGVMRMALLPAVELRAGEIVRFAPGGSHLMIFGLHRDVKPGARVPLDFHFAGGRVVRVTATTVAPGGGVKPADKAAMDHGINMAH